jgi:multisubunit Na+/H+ antiporter MnhE subunit
MWKLLTRRLPGNVHRLAFWILCYALLWQLLAAGEGWYTGLPVVLLAGGLSAFLKVQPWSFRPICLPRFIWFFLTNLFHDAARVAIHSLRLKQRDASAWVYYRMQTRDLRVQVALATMLGLFPGTLAARTEGEVLHIHLLDKSRYEEQRAAQLEKELRRLIALDEVES